ncbi:MAG: hypothetical protein J7K46_05345 [Bacteroidales bacterium]|nr:hypothetical protein [Bacteroidales bacterium]
MASWAGLQRMFEAVWADRCSTGIDQPLFVISAPRRGFRTIQCINDVQVVSVNTGINEHVIVDRGNG